MYCKYGKSIVDFDTKYQCQSNRESKESGIKYTIPYYAGVVPLGKGDFKFEFQPSVGG